MALTKTLVYITCLCFARVFCDDYGEIGKEITLTPNIRGKPAEIMWKHNENLVLEYDGSEVVEYGSFRGRVVVDFETGQLTIRKLNRKDSGQYQSDILIDGIIQTSSHSLTVLDALPAPQVSCKPGETSNVNKLLCSVKSRTKTSYEWSGPNIKVQSGPELLVEELEENRDSVYTCTVKNQANSKSSNFTLKDCHTGKAGSTVLVPVLIVIILLILLTLLAVFLYRRKQKPKQSDLKEIDPENGEGKILLNTESIPGSSDATIPSHNRLPFQEESIADKNWDQDNGLEYSGEGQKLLKETKTPRSVSETNQEDKGNGNEGQLEKNQKNSKDAVEGEVKTYSKTDETEKEGHKPLQSQEEEEEKEKSVNGEKLPDHQNKRIEERKTEDNNEDNQTPGATEETTDRRDAGEGQNLLRNVPPDVMTGSSDATIPSHTRLPSQKESIADKNWDQDNGSEYSGEGQKLLKETKTPRSVSETNQEDKGNGNEGELEKNQKNSKDAVEAEEKTYSKPDETEKEGHKPLQSQEEEEEKEKSVNGEKSPDHQNKRIEERKTEDNNEDNQTPGATEETTDRRDAETVNPGSAVTERNHVDTENEAEQLQENEKSQSDDGEQSLEQQNKSQRNQKTEDNNEDNQTPGATEETTDRRDTETVNPGSAVTERNHVDTENEAEQLQENEKSQSDDGEQSLEQQNKSQRNQKTEDNNEDNQTPGATEETTDRRDTETVSPGSAVTERNHVDTENRPEQLQENEKSQSDDGEQSLEQQNKSQRNQKTEDAAGW